MRVKKLTARKYFILRQCTIVRLATLCFLAINIQLKPERKWLYLYSMLQVS